jgi:hypothetical protein
VHMLSLFLSLLTFYCSPSFFLSFTTIWFGLWLYFLSFMHWKKKREREKNLSHLYTCRTKSIRRKSSLFWYAWRKLARINSNTLQLRSVHVCTCAYVF